MKASSMVAAAARRPGLAAEVAPLEAEPLAAEADLAGERRIGRDELRSGSTSAQ